MKTESGQANRLPHLCGALWGRRFACPALLLVAAASLMGQVSVLVVNNSSETPVTTTYNFGSVAAGSSAAAQFRLRNQSSNTAASITILKVAGAGFAISGGPGLPYSLKPQASVDFVVTFHASDTGGYSSTLTSDGISVLLTATVVPGLTYQVQTAGGNQTLGASAIDFGSLSLGQAQVRHFVITNQTSQALAVPPLSVSAGDFSFSGTSPSGTAVQPGALSGFDLQFRPSATGTRSGTLTIGSNTYGLTGTGTAAASPKPHLTITLSQTASAQQGSVTVGFDSPAAAAGSGAVTLQFRPSNTSAQDPAVVFASGSQTAPFTYQTGDVQATFGQQRSVQFQTGTTAGTITFAVQLAAGSDQQSIIISPAPVAVSSTQPSRSPASLQVQIIGFDNTRTAGKITFTFYDAAGIVVNPGAIAADATAAFAQYFAGSGLGGNFHVLAVFPVTGDTSSITYVQAAFTNSAGTETTQRTSF